MVSLRGRGLTIEAFLFLSILIVASAIRLGWVSASPLDPTETMRALAAWRLHDGLPPGWWDAPLTVLLQTGAFILFGASDAAARLPSLLAGAGGIAALWLYRPWLGRWPVLIAAAFMAISPSAVLAGSRAQEESLALAVTLLLGWRLLRALDERGSKDGLWPALGMAALLTLGYPGVTGLLALALFAAAVTTVHALQGRPLPVLWSPSVVPIAAIVAALFLLTTSFLHFIPGAGLPSLVAWTQHFEPTWEPYPWYRSWLLLGASDLPALALGVPTGIAALLRWAARDPSPEDDALAFFGLWSVMALAFLLLSPTAGLAQLSLVAVPSTVLTGHLLARGLRGLTPQLLNRRWVNLGAAALLLTFAGLVLLQTSVRPDGGLFSSRTLAFIALVAAALLLSPAVLAQHSRPISALAGVAFSFLALVHGLATLAMPGNWPGAAQVNPAMVSALTQLTATSPYTGIGSAPQVGVANSVNDAVAWPLRSVIAVNFGAEPPPEVDIIVTSEAAAQELTGVYRAHPMTLVEAKNFQDWGGQEVWRWLVFGELPMDPAATQRGALLVRTPG